MGRVILGERADAPAGIHVGLKEAPDHALRPSAAVYDSRPEEVARIRCYSANLLLIGVEREGVAALILHPKSFVEVLLKGLSLRPKFLRPGRLSFLLAEFRHAKLGVVDIALQLADRDGLLNLRAIGVNDGDT